MGWKLSQDVSQGYILGKSQFWITWWLGAIKRQAITLAKFMMPYGITMPQWVDDLMPDKIKGVCMCWCSFSKLVQTVSYISTHLHISNTCCIIKVTCKLHNNTIKTKLYIVMCNLHILLFTFLFVSLYTILLLWRQFSSLTNGEADVFQVQHQKCWIAYL